jgi:hypothetical protein
MFGTILLAVDGSKPAEKAVELAARIARPTEMRSSSST